MHWMRICHFWECQTSCCKFLKDANALHEKNLLKEKFIIIDADLKFYENTFYLFSYKSMDEWVAASDEIASQPC